MATRSGIECRERADPAAAGVHRYTREGAGVQEASLRKNAGLIISGSPKRNSSANFLAALVGTASKVDNLGRVVW